MLSAIFTSENTAASTIMRNAVKPISVPSTTHELRYTCIVIIIAVKLWQMSCAHGAANIRHLYTIIKIILNYDTHSQTSAR